MEMFVIVRESAGASAIPLSMRISESASAIMVFLDESDALDYISRRSLNIADHTYPVRPPRSNDLSAFEDSPLARLHGLELYLKVMKAV
jgi:hypothetical protein